MSVAPIVRPIVSAIVRGISGGNGGFNPLVFHALDDVDGSFVADVIVGVGNIAEARTTTNYAPNASSVWTAYTSGQAVQEYANGKWWVKGEPAHTNSLPYSKPDSNWTETGTSVIGADAAGLTGVSSGAQSAVILTDDDGAALEYVDYSTGGITANTDTHVARFFIKKDTDETRFPQFRLQCGGRISRYVNTKTGAITTAALADLGTVDAECRDTGHGWWELLLQVQNSGSTSALHRIFPAESSVWGSASTAATGSVTIANCELHLNTTIAAVRGSSPIFTSGSAASTVATSLSFDDANHDDTQGGWYAEIMLGGELVSTTTSTLIGLGALGRIFRLTDSPNRVRTYDGTTEALVSATLATDTAYSVGLAYGESKQKLNYEATWGSEAAYDGAFNNSASALRILADNASVSTNTPAVRYIRNIKRWNADYTTVQSLIDTEMSS